jgi:hypothetical protein
MLANYRIRQFQEEEEGEPASIKQTNANQRKTTEGQTEGTKAAKIRY